MAAEIMSFSYTMLTTDVKINCAMNNSKLNFEENQFPKNLNKLFRKHI